MGSPYIYRHRPGWLYAAVAGAALLVPLLAAALVVDGFEAVRFFWMLLAANWCWTYGTGRSFEVTVDESTITFRRVVGVRSRPIAELTQVVDIGAYLVFLFGKRREMVFRGDGADLLVDRVHQLRPSLRDPLTPPDFAVVLRGYERTAVDDYLARRRDAVISGDDPTSPTRPTFPTAMRGYERTQVRAYLGDPHPLPPTDPQPSPS